MSAAPRSRSGRSQRLAKFVSSSDGSSAAVESFLSILKQAATKSHVLASPPDQTLHLLFRSMTTAQRKEAIGLLKKMNDDVGSLFVRCLRTHQSLSYSKTASTTSPSSCGRLESEYLVPRKTLCSSTTRSNRKVKRT